MLRSCAVLSSCLVALLATTACNSPDNPTDDAAATEEGETSDPDALTWWRDVEPIVGQKCATCHADGNIAPFALETHEQFVAFSDLARTAIEAGVMPPWPPDPSCNSFTHSRALTPEQEQTMLSYIASDMPEGDPADAPPEPEPAPEFVPDVIVEMAEAYTPVGTEDYRCFLIPWPEDIDVDQYVTGIAVYPGEESIVHHVIIFSVEEENVGQYLDLDAAEPGAGYTCFGGPNATPGSANWLGGWAPGVQPFRSPDGAGQRVSPGTMLVMQVHYNVSGAALSDRTSVGFEMQPTVERPAVVLPLTDLQWLAGNGSMMIPAGDPDVMHETVTTADYLPLVNALAELGAAPGSDLDIFDAGLHMHMIGTRGRVEVRDQGGGNETCLIDIPDWDFHWQSNFTFEQPVRLRSDQELHLQCWWDNSAANQPIIDGEQLEPIDRDWGEGTLDEMCLGILYVTAAAD
jgi:hypothetical protein